MFNSLIPGIANRTKPNQNQLNLISQIYKFSVSLIILQTNLIHFICRIIVKFYCMGCMGGFELNSSELNLTIVSHINRAIHFNFVGQWPKYRLQFMLQMYQFSQLPSELDPCYYLPFFLNNKLFSDTNGKRALMAAFSHCCDIFAYSCLKLKPILEQNTLFETRRNWFYV